MEILYLVLIVFLVILAASDLVVGVANDAVNFLNAAVGARAAPFKVIMFVAALGVLVGATFSTGMMEVARKGIFNPEQFLFAEVIIIFLAVMITDVIILDVFNTYGLPTSTTVSLVFELLGASVAMAAFKIHQAGEGLQELARYINSERALGIISGILLSIVVAFTVGLLVQYLSRLIFTFQYKKMLPYFGSLWGGLALMVITYFMVIKGAKGASFLTPENMEWINAHTGRILWVSFLGWTVLLQILTWIFRFDVLKFVVLAGTFALAMAFAGNDLVNFIGVPLAGVESYRAWVASGGLDPYEMSMEVLLDPVKTSTLVLLLAGAVMVVTLWTSRKAKGVIDTTVDLSRQGEGMERFGSNMASRSLVRIIRNIYANVNKGIPDSITNILNKRFEMPQPTPEQGEPRSSFDMIRASVNLIVASILIAYGTSHKLPLSTTYVAFMVAMGTSLADRAWGRESAVYRISGVLSVISGWFLTAIVAFSSAFIMASIINIGGVVVIILLLALAIFVIIRTHRIHKIRYKEKQEALKTAEGTGELDSQTILNQSVSIVSDTLLATNVVFGLIIQGVADEDIKALRKTNKEVDRINKLTKGLKDSVNKTILKLRDEDIESGHYYVQVMDYMREISHSLNYIATPCFNHIVNQHKGLDNVQEEDLKMLVKDAGTVFSLVQQMISQHDYTKMDDALARQNEVLETISRLRKKQIKRTKSDGNSTRRSILFLDVLSETKNLMLFTINLAKSMRDFIQNAK